MGLRAKMRLGGWLSALALVAAGCDSSGTSSGAGEADGGEAVDSTLANVSITPEEAAQLRARAVTALAAVMPGATAADYANVRSGPGRSVCGEVDAGDGLGRRLFLVTGDGTAIVNTGPELRLEDPEDPFPDLYMQYCATAAELRQIGARMQRVRPLDVPAEPPLIGGEIPMPAGDSEAGAAPPPGPQPPAEGRRPSDDSFFNSVLRSPRRGAPPG